MIHELKTWPEYFERLGRKKLEIRKNDRNYQVGDILVLNEYAPLPGKGFTGRQVKALVTDVVKLGDVPGLAEPLVIKDFDGKAWEDMKKAHKANTGDDLNKVIIHKDIDAYEFVALSLQFMDPIGILSEKMRERIAHHPEKGPADDIHLTGGQCLDQLRTHVTELEHAMIDLGNGKEGITREQVLKKAADVANYAAFCAQVSQCFASHVIG